MDADLLSRMLDSIVGSGPIAGLLFYLLWLERKERMELQQKLIESLEANANVLHAATERMRLQDAFLERHHKDGGDAQ